MVLLYLSSFLIDTLCDVLPFKYLVYYCNSEPYILIISFDIMCSLCSYINNYYLYNTVFHWVSCQILMGSAFLVLMLLSEALSLINNFDKYLLASCLVFMTTFTGVVKNLWKSLLTDQIGNKRQTQ